MNHFTQRQMGPFWTHVNRSVTLSGFNGMLPPSNIEVILEAWCIHAPGVRVRDLKNHNFTLFLFNPSVPVASAAASTRASTSDVNRYTCLFTPGTST